MNPQSKQIVSFGNTNTAGLFTFINWEKWMLVSETNVDSFDHAHDGQDIQIPPEIFPTILLAGSMGYCTGAHATLSRNIFALEECKTSLVFPSR